MTPGRVGEQHSQVKWLSGILYRRLGNKFKGDSIHTLGVQVI